MKKLFLIVTACVLVGGALGGCGDDFETTVPPPVGDDGGSNGTSGGTSGTSGGGADDAGIEGGASSGSASNPGKVSCGASECTLGTQICCQSFNDAGCIAQGANCSAVEVECDETADCPDGQRCCLERSGSGSGRARCQKNCNAGRFLCKTNAECGDAACTATSCFGRTFQTCGPPRPPPQFCNETD
jgi:hypothetical protein